MPHQCLSCGHAFPEGSAALLKGCPQCKGTRFFYTPAAVGDDERKALARESQQDLRNVVADMLQHTSPEAAEQLKAQADEDGWAELTAKDLRKLVKQVQDAAKQPGAAGGLDPQAPISKSEHAKRREQAAAAARRVLAAQTPGESKPDTVTVEETGSYAIDVQGLLEKNPIVIQKDGAYLIHLPSLFSAKR